MKTSVGSALGVAAVVSAQTTLPVCITDNDCDAQGVALSGCSDTNSTCHCLHASQIAGYVVPCLEKTSNCTQADYTAFASFVQTTCASSNISITNGTSTNATNATTSTYSVPSATSITPYTGAAARATGAVVAFVGVAAGALAMS